MESFEESVVRALFEEEEEEEREREEEEEEELVASSVCVHYYGPVDKERAEISKGTHLHDK